MKFMMSDNGGEYTSQEFNEYLASEGIEHQLTISEKPEQNRVVECLNQTPTKHARNMRSQADMSEGFWVEAVSHTSYLVNRSPSTIINFQISEEIWQGESVDYSTLQIFGCPTYSLVDSQKRKRLESKSKSCYFIGFTKRTKAYKL